MTPKGNDGQFLPLHGMTNSKIWCVWRAMNRRCNEPNNVSYKYYGAKGIKVCKRWVESFNNFYEDMGPMPSEDYQIDRIDNNGDYTPDNCRWVTRIDNVRNRSDNLFITCDGQTKTAAEWSEITGIRSVTIV